MNKQIQAKHISDLKMLQVVRDNQVRMQGLGGYWSEIPTCEVWTFTNDLCHSFPDVPTKVVRAKLASLVKRGLLIGCTCGCRGDFHPTQKGIELLEGNNELT